MQFGKGELAFAITATIIYNVPSLVQNSAISVLKKPIGYALNIFFDAASPPRIGLDDGFLERLTPKLGHLQHHFTCFGVQSIYVRPCSLESPKREPSQL